MISLFLSTTVISTLKILRPSFLFNHIRCSFETGFHLSGMPSISWLGQLSSSSPSPSPRLGFQAQAHLTRFTSQVRVFFGFQQTSHWLWSMWWHFSRLHEIWSFSEFRVHVDRRSLSGWVYSGVFCISNLSTPVDGWLPPQVLPSSWPLLLKLASSFSVYQTNS